MSQPLSKLEFQFKEDLKLKTTIIYLFIDFFTCGKLLII